ncbi:MAG: GNAT family N-acetyltransferase [Crocinitomicaceae bacterium]|nr:GNAT family N-acetyltransferase [Crocinitomicaceae bacterium]
MQLETTTLYYSSAPGSPEVSLAALSLPFRQIRYSTIQRNLAALSEHFTWCSLSFNPQHNLRRIIQCQTQQQKRKGYFFVILDRDGSFVGEIGVDAIFPYQQFANVYYWVDAKHQGKGLASEAFKLLQQWVQSNLFLKTLQIRMDVSNVASQRVVLKAGAKLIDVTRNYQHKNGRISDVHTFSLEL